MSTHPNAILQLTLQPQDLPRKTLHAILRDAGVDPDSTDRDRIDIGGEEYIVKLMEDVYDDSYQVGAPTGAIVVFDMVTYGYGEKIAWDKLVKQKAELEKWAKKVCVKHSCTVHEFAITANYW